MTTSKSSNKTPDREGNGSRVIPMDENTQREFIKNMNNIIQECTKRWREYELMFTMLCMGWYGTAIIQQVTGIHLTVALQSNSAVLSLLVGFFASPSSTLISSSYYYLPVTLLGCGLLLRALNRTYDISIMDHEEAVIRRNEEYNGKDPSIIRDSIIPIGIYILSWIISIWICADGTGPRASSWVLLCAPPVGVLFASYVQHAIYDAHLGLVKLSQLKYSEEKQE